MSDQVLCQADGGVITITINRPQRRNALTVEVVEDLLGRLRAATADPACRVVVITGAEAAFSSGADLLAAPQPDLALLERAKELITVMTTCDQPVIARVPGLCVGIGVPIALAADLVVAAQSAYFLMSFVGIALTPDGGATAIVPAHIGRARAMSMALAPERIPAPTALDWGMIHQVVPDEELDQQVSQLADRLVEGSKEALAATKHNVNAATLEHLDDAIEREAKEQSRLVVSTGFRSAVEAFEQRRR